MRRLQPPRSPVHTAFWVDAAFEFVAGGAQLLLSDSIGRWLNVDRALIVTSGVVFIGAALAIALFALQAHPRRGVVSALAAANLAGGAAIWFMVALRWSEFAPQGRWLAAAVADSFVAVALLEFLALRRTTHPTSVSG
ncbi:MAG: hypothetical protein ABI782_02910 [Anaerolineaceae bacterium]